MRPTVTLLLLLFIPACENPCRLGPTRSLPDLDSLTLACEDPDAPTGSDSSSDGSSAGSSSTTEPPPAPTCVAVPGAGELWGPCNDGECVGGFCKITEAGSLCVAACAGDVCEPFKCLNGMCLADGECIPSCLTAADCPLPGMVCDTDQDHPRCVHPTP